MKATLLILSLLSSTSLACMADEDCVGNDITMCCYMNECQASSSIGCSGKRLDFYRLL